MFTERDRELFASKNISSEKVQWQIEQFIKGVEPVKLERAATSEKEIIVLENFEDYIRLYDNSEIDVLKFVPASGAASRMFKVLFEFKFKLEEEPETDIEDFPSIKKFFTNIKKFAFYNELNKLLLDQGGVERLINGKKYGVILNGLLTSEGLDYGQLPKGLLSFHFYAGGVARTPFEEHLEEGAKYAYSKGKTVKLHFTVSPEHVNAFKKHKELVVNKYQEMYDVKYDISFSVQKPSTDTIAVTEEDKPFYDDGEILFRPGGHGALIENLNDIDADIIYIKNIDNVVPEKRIGNTIKYKKALGGYILEVQKKVFDLIIALENSPEEQIIGDAKQLLSNTFNLSESCINKDEDNLVSSLIDRLNRPIRVCGMVKNEGEPGGGPFLVTNKNGCVSPQVVESSQVNLNVPEQKEIFENSTHFNPVDLVCSVRNYKGEKFNLPDYVDLDTCFISHKSKDGRDLKALELPGLWNGAMAGWNTIFIEVSMDTFNPVKTINDLLRDAHQ